jgi:cation:H+ antiporter
MLFDINLVPTYKDAVIFFLAGLFLMAFSSKFVVGSVIKISRVLHIKAFAISFALVALATSFPELAIGINAALQNETQIIIGNIIGSNIADLLLIMGLSVLLKPVFFKEKNCYPT